jgi:pimeloyl-ACP methyl ester carboxylesterase
MSTYTAAGPQTFTFASQVDHAPIFVRKWLPPCGIRPRATVQITHGIAEHSGRYDRFARFLTAEGYVVYALDLRGHGETAGPDNLGQAGLAAWEDMTADIKQLAEIARAEYPALSLIAFGHTIGCSGWPCSSGMLRRPRRRRTWRPRRRRGIACIRSYFRPTPLVSLSPTAELDVAKAARDGTAI